MKVLVTATPGLGHIYPLVPLAQALRDDGHEVTWALAPGSCERVGRFGFECHPAGADRELVFALRREQEPAFIQDFLDSAPRNRRRSLFPMFVSFAAPPMLADLPHVIDDVEPDLIVHEPMEFAAAPAATTRGIPHATVGFGGFIPESILQDHTPHFVRLWETVGLGSPDAGGLYDHLYLSPWPPSLGAQRANRNIHPLRPLGFDGTIDATAPDWVSGLGRARPFVYATFGTEIAALAPFGPVLEGIGELDVDAVLTVGHEFNPATLGTTPDNLRVEKYIPQRFLLPHASVLISHAGSGTVLGAAAYGVPQLSLPIAADQFENADAVSSAGAGLTLEPDEIDAPAIADAAQQLITATPRMQRARQLADEIAAMPHPKDQVPLLAALTHGSPQQTSN